MIGHLKGLMEYTIFVAFAWTIHSMPTRLKSYWIKNYLKLLYNVQYLIVERENNENDSTNESDVISLHDTVR